MQILHTTGTKNHRNQAATAQRKLRNRKKEAENEMKNDCMKAQAQEQLLVLWDSAQFSYHSLPSSDDEISGPFHQGNLSRLAQSLCRKSDSMSLLDAMLVVLEAYERLPRVSSTAGNTDKVT